MRIPSKDKRQAKNAVRVLDRRPKEPVEPIKSLDDIARAKQWFLDQTPRFRNSANNLRNYMMFVICINNANRISDLLTLRIGDVMFPDGTLRDELFIREDKTEKTRFMFFGPASKEAIQMYLDAIIVYEPDDFLFVSRNRGKDGKRQPISRKMAWKIVSDMGREISEGRPKPLHLGTHSMRKTFGYQRIKANPDDPMIVAQVSEMFNHSSMSTTYRYLGFDIESKRELCVDHEL